MTKLRLSPSGPIVGDIGPGFPLRCAQDGTNGSSPPDTLVLTGAYQTLYTSAVLAGGLTNWDPAKKYGLECNFDASNGSSTTVAKIVSQMSIEVNGSGTWVDQGEITHSLAGVSTAAGTGPNVVPMIYRLVPALGSARGPAIAAGATVRWRIQVKATALEATFVKAGGSVFGSMTEYFG